MIVTYFSLFKMLHFFSVFQHAHGWNLSSFFPRLLAQMCCGMQNCKNRIFHFFHILSSYLSCCCYMHLNRSYIKWEKEKKSTNASNKWAKVLTLAMNFKRAHIFLFTCVWPAILTSNIIILRISKHCCRRDLQFKKSFSAKLNKIAWCLMYDIYNSKFLTFIVSFYNDLISFFTGKELKMLNQDFQFAQSYIPMNDEKRSLQCISIHKSNTTLFTYTLKNTYGHVCGFSQYVVKETS